MKNLKKVESLKNMKFAVIKLYKIYMAQANQNKLGMNCYHENGHDNSGSHPDYHSDSHDNTPGRMMIHTLVKNGTN